MPRERPAVRAEVISYGLVASGVDLSRKVRDGKRVKIRSEGWQAEAWRFFDITPEYRYAATWAGNVISKALLYPTENGKQSTNKLAVEAMANLYGGPEGQSEMLRKLGVHLTVAGEAFLVAFDNKVVSDWEVVSNNAIQRSGDGFRIDGEDFSDILVVRIWQPHPRDVKLADSPSRAVLPVLSELEVLTKRVAAQGESRLTGNGLLFLPSEVSFPSEPNTTAAGSDPSSSAQVAADGVARILIDAASRAIADPASAAAMIPLVFTAPGEYLDKIQHVTLWSELDAQAPELRAEAIKRIALGMDMPPEALTGMADMNHWSAWQMEEAAIKAHSEPFLARIADALAEGYLRPYLEEGGMDPEEAAHYGIDADTSKLRLRPNRSKEATELYDRAELSGAALLRENGFDPEDAMDDKERVAWFLRKVASGSTTPELVEAALQAIGAALTPAVSDQAPTEERPTPSLREHPVTGPPTPPPAGGPVTESTIAAAEVMVYRALERAGNRLKNRFGRNPKPGVPAADLYLYVPRRTEAEIDDLLDDAWSCVDRFDCGLPPALLAHELNSYARMLMLDQRPHDRVALASFLSPRPIAAVSA